MASPDECGVTEYGGKPNRQVLFSSGGIEASPATMENGRRVFDLN